MITGIRSLGTEMRYVTSRRTLNSRVSPVLICISFFFSGLISSAYPTETSDSKNIASEFSTRASAEAVDLADAALRIAKAVHPEVSIPRYRAEIAKIILKLKPLVRSKPHRSVEIINSFLFRERSTKVNLLSGNTGSGAEEESLLSHVLDRWEGNCLGFSTLYLALAASLKLPIFPVLAPGHIFVRYDDGRVRKNIETTAKGVNLAESEMARQLRITMTPEHQPLGTYFHQGTNADVIASIFANAGLLLFGQGRVDEALHFFQTALKLNPKSGEAHINLGLVLIKQNKHQQALNESDLALALYPESVQAHLNRGISLKNLNRIDEATKAYRQAIAIHPNFSPAYYNLANLYDGVGKVDEAIHNYTQAIKFNRFYARAYFNRAVLYLEEKHQPNLAIADLNTVVKLDRKYSEAYFARAMAFKQMGKALAARKDLIQFNELNPQAAQERKVPEMIGELTLIEGKSSHRAVGN